MCCFVVRAWWGVGRTQPGAIHITSSHCWNNCYEWGRYWHKPASTKSTLKTYFQDEKELCDWWAGSVFCDRSHWRFHKTEWVLLPDMPKGRICTYPWQFRGVTTPSRDPAFREGSTSPPWDSWMACAWFRWFRRQASDWRWAGEAAWEISAGSLSGSGQRVPVPRKLDSGCFRKHWSSTSSALQSFVTHRCASNRWELRVGWTSLWAICPDGQPSKRQCCVVAQWSFG